MSVTRQFNFTSQMRVDVPHLRTLDSATAADFDVTIGRLTSGGRALVVRGFAMTNSAGAAIALQMATADGIITNLEASASGSFLWIPPDRAIETLNPQTNSRISGAWTQQTNYVGLDFKRTADESTADLVQFLDPGTDIESPRQIPLARTLDYTIIISTVPFAAQPNIVPIAKVTVDEFGNITSCVDARPMMFRLGSGGDAPNNKYGFTWADGRKENTTPNDLGFVGGDKVLGDQKSWMDAIMTRMWELGGGEYWYSSSADRNVQLAATGTPFSGGESFQWNLGTSTLSWTNIGVLFSDSTGTYNLIADGSAVLDGVTYDCMYVDLDRTQNATLTYQRGLVSTLGPGSPPGSRHIIARRVGNAIYTKGWQYKIGAVIAVATTTSNGIVTLSRASAVPTVISDGGGIIVAPASTNNTGLSSTGDGTGAGIIGLGAGSVASLISGQGGFFKGAALGGTGVYGWGVGGSPGVYARAEGNGDGVAGDAGGTGVGGRFNGGFVTAPSTNGGTGVKGTGGGSSQQGGGIGGDFRGGTGGTLLGAGAIGVLGGYGVQTAGGVGGNGTTQAGGGGYGAVITGGTGGVAPIAGPGGTGIIARGGDAGAGAIGAYGGVGGAFQGGTGSSGSPGGVALKAIAAIGEAAPTTICVVVDGGNITFNGDADPAQHPSHATGFTNTITAGNINTAWAELDVNGADTLVTVASGFNVATASRNTIIAGSVQVIIMNFASALDTAKYSVAVTALANTVSTVGVSQYFYIPTVVDRTTTSVTIAFWNATSHAFASSLASTKWLVTVTGCEA